MQKTRSWQDSFDRLEEKQRDERRIRAAEARQIRDTEAAYARAAAAEAVKPVVPALMLVGTQPDSGELLVEPKRQRKAAKAKAAPRKRATTPRTATKMKSKPTKPRVARKPKPAKPAGAALPPTPGLPATQAAELLLITPLPRSAALIPYRKTGLFGLIGSWLRSATRQATSGVAGGLRRSKAAAKPRLQIDELAILRAENKRLRGQLEALLSPNATRQE